ncbi:MAG: hypothetical protein ACYC6Y_25625, partial [Thermoguttaceae bacterium]
MPLRTILALVILLGAAGMGLAAGLERTTLLVTFDEAKIGPRVACDGRLELRGGGEVRLLDWCNDGKDAFDGSSYSITTGHDAATAKAAKVQAAYRSSLARGMIVELDGPAGATLLAKTRLGDFEVPLAELGAKPVVSLLEGKIQVQKIPDVTPLGGDQAEEEYPSVAVLPDGRTAA